MKIISKEKIETDITKAFFNFGYLYNKEQGEGLLNGYGYPHINKSRVGMEFRNELVKYIISLLENYESNN